LQFFAALLDFLIAATPFYLSRSIRACDCSRAIMALQKVIDNDMGVHL
jgi:hypothetical protein